MTHNIQDELLSARDELARMRDETAGLKRDNEQLRAFTPMLAHELGGPLRGMTLFSQFVIQKHAGELSGDALRDLQQISCAANRLRQLTHDLLAYARFGEKTVRKFEVDTAA